MRSKLFLAGVMFVIGCGGGGKKAMIVDGAIDSPTIDAAPTCAVQCEISATVCGASFNMPTFPALRFGQPAGMGNGPVKGDWFVMFTQGDLNGRKAFDIILNMSPEGVAMPDVLAIRLLKPAAGNFPINQAQTFDPNPNTAVPNAWSFWLGDVTLNGGMIADVRQEYYANMGSITVTAIGEADGANITGSTAPITWREIDDQGADVAGGCTASMGVGSASNTGFSFNLLQMAGAFQQDQQNYGDGPRPATGDLAAAVKKYMDQKISAMQQ
jgi:hypothetical protein